MSPIPDSLSCRLLGLEPRTVWPKFHTNYFFRGPVDLDALVAWVAEDVRRAAPRSASVDVRVDAGSRCVRGCASVFERILRSLTTNAIEATSRGGDVRVDVSVTASDAGEVVRIVVADTGVGTSDATLQATASGQAAQHGGTLEITSAPGAGTTVVVELPAAFERGETAGVTFEELRGSERVAVVDLNGYQRIAIGRGLASLGYAASCADSSDDFEAMREADVVVVYLHQLGEGAGLYGPAPEWMRWYPENRNSTLVRTLRERPDLSIVCVEGRLERHFGPEDDTLERIVDVGYDVDAFWLRDICFQERNWVESVRRVYPDVTHLDTIERVLAKVDARRTSDVARDLPLGAHLAQCRELDATLRVIEKEYGDEFLPLDSLRKYVGDVERISAAVGREIRLVGVPYSVADLALAIRKERDRPA